MGRPARPTESALLMISSGMAWAEASGASVMIDSVGTGLTEDVPAPIWTEGTPGRV